MGSTGVSLTGCSRSHWLPGPVQLVGFPAALNAFFETMKGAGAAAELGQPVLDVAVVVTSQVGIPTTPAKELRCFPVMLTVTWTPSYAGSSAWPGQSCRRR